MFVNCFKNNKPLNRSSSKTMSASGEHKIVPSDGEHGDASAVAPVAASAKAKCVEPTDFQAHVLSKQRELNPLTIIDVDGKLLSFVFGHSKSDGRKAYHKMYCTDRCRTLETVAFLLF